MTAAELAAELGITERTLRLWRTKGIVPPPNGRTRGATYDGRHLRLGREYLKFREEHYLTRHDFIERMGLAGTRRDPDAA